MGAMLATIIRVAAQCCHEVAVLELLLRADCSFRDGQSLLFRTALSGKDRVCANGREGRRATLAGEGRNVGARVRQKDGSKHAASWRFLSLLAMMKVQQPAVVQQLCWGIATRQELCRMQGPVRLQSSAAFTPLDYTTMVLHSVAASAVYILHLSWMLRSELRARSYVGVWVCHAYGLLHVAKGLSSPLIVLLCMAWRFCQRRRWLECGLNTPYMRRTLRVTTTLPGTRMH